MLCQIRFINAQTFLMFYYVLQLGMSSGSKLNLIKFLEVENYWRVER